MKDSSKLSTDTETVKFFSDVLSKLASDRTREENEKMIEILEELDYFRDHINDPSERREFIRAASQFFEYNFYPRGVTLCHQGDLSPDFGIILAGKAWMFEQKTKQEIINEQDNLRKLELLEIYRQYAKDNGLFKKFKRLQSFPSPPKLQKAFSKTRDFSNIENEASIIEETPKNEDVIDEILGNGNSIIPSYKTKNDLSFEEKLIFLSSFEGAKNYFKDGKVILKKRREIQTGNSIGEASLSIDMPFEYTIVASEDIHIISMKKDWFSRIYDEGFANFKKKRKFLSMVFPTLPYEIVLNLSAFVEEKICSNWEYIYEEGEQPEGIYIVKTGEVQLLKFDEEEKIENVPGSLVLKEKPKAKFLSKQKLLVGSVDVTGVFGEEEITKNVPRKYSAKSNSPSTFLYVIPVNIYREVLEKCFPLIVQAFKSMVRPKSQYRKERIEKGQKIATELQLDEPNKPENKEKDTTDKDHKAPKKFSKKRNLEINLSLTQAIICEERMSRIAKKPIEITLTKPKEIIQVQYNTFTPKANTTHQKFLSISPKAENFFPAPEDMENLKTKLFKRYQKKSVDKKHAQKSIFVFPEESYGKKQTNLRCYTSKNQSRKVINLSPRGSVDGDKIAKSNNETRIPSLNLDKLPEENGHPSKSLINFFTTFTPKQTVPSISSFAEAFKKNTKINQFDAFQDIPNKPKSCTNQSQLKGMNFSGLPVNSFAVQKFKSSKQLPTERSQKEIPPQNVGISNYEPAGSLMDLNLCKQDNSNKSEINKVFVFNRGQGETKLRIIKTHSSKGSLIDGNFGHFMNAKSKFQKMGSSDQLH